MDHSMELPEDTLPLELALAADRLDRQQQRTIDRDGHGATIDALALAERLLPRLTQAVSEAIETASLSEYTRALQTHLKPLGAEHIALCIIQTALHLIGTGCKLCPMADALGHALAAECWAASGLDTQGRSTLRLDKRVRAWIAKDDRRRARALQRAKATSYGQREWTSDLSTRAGAWALEVLTRACGDVFDVFYEGAEAVISLTDRGMAIMDNAVAAAVMRNPVYLPMIEEPALWDRLFDRGYRDKRIPTRLLRSRHKDRLAAAKAAIEDGAMKPALDAINALQSVPWTINKPILDVVRACRDNRIAVPGLPAWERIPEPQRPPEGAEDAAVRLWKLRRHEVRVANMSINGDRTAFAEALATAERMAQHERFYTPMNMDWRGRVYAMSHFNFQREDYIRALFLFADGEPIGEEGLYWLKVHVANCGDFNKISKRPFKERVEWVDQNQDQILERAHDPFMTGADWIAADKPFLFLAACVELASALREGPAYCTRLPVSFDGSCSGLQHLCAMTRAAEGSLVNLTCSDTPNDVYATIAERVKAAVTEDLTSEDERISAIAKMALAHGIDRKLVKRNVMTYSYSSKKFGMAAQQQEDLMEPLARELLEGKREEHPFGTFGPSVKSSSGARIPGRAARFLAERTFAAIEEVVDRPAKAMAFLQRLAKALAHEGKPLRWTTPVGLPWINRYHQPTTQRITLWLHEKGVRMPYRMLVATGEKRGIDKDKAANGVAPNFVHALDAAHLLRTVNASRDQDIRAIATVHDSFGCLAPRAREFRKLIRSEFVRMYEDHNVLQEILAQAQADLTQHNQDTLPDVPQFGPLELREVLDAEFAFA